MLKKLELMIQLNSQEITEATELHPVTTFEQGRREGGKTAKSKPPNPYRERTQRTLKKAAVPPAPKIPPLNTLNTLKKEAIPEGCESARHPSRFHFVPVCGTPEQTGTKWNLEVPCRTTRLRGSLPIRRAQVCLGLASFIARSSTRTSPRFGLRSGVKAEDSWGHV